MTAPWKVLKWNRCAPSLPVSRPDWISCNINCSNSKPNMPRHARRLQLVKTSRSFVLSWIHASWRRSPSFDGNEAPLCRVALHFRGKVRSSGFGRGAEAVDLVDSRRGKPRRLRSAARCFPEEQGCVLSPGCVVQKPSAGSCPRSAEACRTRGMASDGPCYEPQVGSRLNAMLVGVLSPVWRQGDSYQFEEDLTAWDTRITEYERQSSSGHVGQLVSKLQLPAEVACNEFSTRLESAEPRRTAKSKNVRFFYRSAPAARSAFFAVLHPRYFRFQHRGQKKTC